MLADARLFAGSIDLLAEKFKPGAVDAVVGIDARGFIFAAAAAANLRASNTFYFLGCVLTARTDRDVADRRAGHADDHGVA